MNNFSNHLEAILSHSISGYHRYILSEPVHLVYASMDLCKMLDVSEEELLDEKEDLYAGFIYPADREQYNSFVKGYWSTGWGPVL